MASLDIPSNKPKPISRSPSASSLRKPAVEHDNELTPVARGASRRNSDSHLSSASANSVRAASPAIPTAPESSPVAPLTQAATMPASSGSTAPAPAVILPTAAASVASTTVPQKSANGLAAEPQQKLDAGVTGLSPSIAAAAEKAALQAPVDRLLRQPDARKGLAKKSRYFKRMIAETEGHDGSLGTPEQETYEDIDEISMALFKHWLEHDHQLAGPHDFHSLQHYLSLYVLARKFEIEQLENQVMDLTRAYYRAEKMTAPAFRLEYIYAYTTQANAMRSFLIQTAAYRAMCEQQTESDYLISDSIREVLLQNNEMAVDFAEAVVGLAKNDLADPRRGSSCAWHSHEHTPACIPAPAEAWQSDGAADDVSVGGDAATDAPDAPDAVKPADVPVPDAPKPIEAPVPAVIVPPVAKKDEFIVPVKQKTIPVAAVVKQTTVPVAAVAKQTTIPVASKAADAKTVTSATTTKTKWFKRPTFGLKGEAIIAALKFKFHKGIDKAKVAKDKVKGKVAGAPPPPAALPPN
ncbi:unnamed protein product [Zymoseptoria tritici ST99CH_1A5]|uniref:BTB domain-containing protein n=2 Tax=Zymoseptoria tritici TaxID=1047171 RepID=A0A2H1FK02_ZYMTR|nr:unnamed protein product [Zymoseptoria tritici ST99CH_1E4]SMR43830.1 unnamed protein product [Zymoseptoria tritici ST99CH_3D1]SMY18991.1 unnamed protein product [Zymoseptoria tritici ST99CH_1A5]